MRQSRCGAAAADYTDVGSHSFQAGTAGLLFIARDAQKRAAKSIMISVVVPVIHVVGGRAKMYSVDGGLKHHCRSRVSTPRPRPSPKIEAGAVPSQSGFGAIRATYSVTGLFGYH